METFVTGGERQTPVPTSSTVPSELPSGEGQFGYLHNETFSVGYLHTEEITATSKSAPMLRGRGQGQKSSSYHPNRQRKHAQSIESES